MHILFLIDLLRCPRGFQIDIRQGGRFLTIRGILEPPYLPGKPGIVLGNITDI
jgi:hypothetical protein